MTLWAAALGQYGPVGDCALRAFSFLPPGEHFDGNTNDLDVQQASSRIRQHRHEHEKITNAAPGREESDLGESDEWDRSRCNSQCPSPSPPASSRSQLEGRSQGGCKWHDSKLHLLRGFLFYDLSFLCVYIFRRLYEHSFSPFFHFYFLLLFFFLPMFVVRLAPGKRPPYNTYALLTSQTIHLHDEGSLKSFQKRLSVISIASHQIHVIIALQQTGKPPLRASSPTKPDHFIPLVSNRVMELFKGLLPGVELDGWLPEDDLEEHHRRQSASWTVLAFDPSSSVKEAALPA